MFYNVKMQNIEILPVQDVSTTTDNHKEKVWAFAVGKYTF